MGIDLIGRQPLSPDEETPDGGDQIDRDDQDPEPEVDCGYHGASMRDVPTSLLIGKANFVQSLKLAEDRLCLISTRDGPVGRSIDCDPSTLTTVPRRKTRERA